MTTRRRSMRVGRTLGDSRAAPTPSLTRRALRRAVRALREGGIVCMPTETTYGLAVDLRTRGLAELVALKGRDATAPIAMIASDHEQARSLASTWPARADQLARAYWPGPLTLVVPGRRDLPPEVCGAGGGVGVRVSSHRWPRALAGALGAPITATSANPSGRPPALSVAEARAYFGDRVAVYLDGGSCSRPAASTVVLVSEDGAMRVLRRGEIALPELG